MDSDNGVEGQRIASSMSDHVQLLLDLNQKNLDGRMDGTPMSEHQVAILKRALAAGGRVSRADYEQASEGVVDCLRHNNLVKASYTAKEYDEENRRFDKYWNDRRMGRAPTIAETHGHFSFDYSDVDAATCLANNHEAMDVQECKPPEWKPFG